MHRYCLTKLELDRAIRQNRSGGFSPVFFIVMVWWGLFGIIYPLTQIADAFKEGVEHPLSVLIGGPGVMLVICEGLSYLLFRVWRKHRRINAPESYTLARGRCIEKAFHDTEDHSWHSLTAKGQDGSYGEVTVSTDTYNSIRKGEEVYILANGEKEIKALWKYADTYLARDALPMLSHADQMVENQKRAEMEAAAEENESLPMEPIPIEETWNRAARISDELTPDDKRRIRFAFFGRTLIFAVIMLIAFFSDSAGRMLLLGFALMIVIGIVYDSDHGADCAYVSRAYREEKEKLGGGNSEELEKSILRRMRGRRLKLAAANLLRILPCLLLSILGGVLGKDDFSLGCMIDALAFLLLSLRRVVEAYVKKPQNWEQERLSSLLRK